MQIPEEVMRFMVEMYFEQLFSKQGIPHESQNISDLSNIITGQRESPDSVGWEPRGMDALDYLSETMGLDVSQRGPHGQAMGQIPELFKTLGRTPVEAGVTKVGEDTKFKLTEKERAGIAAGSRPFEEQRAYRMKMRYRWDLNAIFKRHGLSQKPGAKEIMNYLPQYIAELNYKGSEIGPEGFSSQAEKKTWILSETMSWLSEAFKEKDLEVPDFEDLGQDLEGYIGHAIK